MRVSFPFLLVAIALLSGCGLRAYALPDASADRAQGIGEVDLRLSGQTGTGAIAAVEVAMHDQGDLYRSVTVRNTDQQISFPALPEGLHDLTLSALDVKGRPIGRFVHQVEVYAGRDLVFPVACIALDGVSNSQPISIQFSPLESNLAAAPLSTEREATSTRSGGPLVLGPSADASR